MNAEIDAMEDRHYRGRLIIEKAGEYAPAWGMIGTLIGLILMLQNLQDPETWPEHGSFPYYDFLWICIS